MLFFGRVCLPAIDDANKSVVKHSSRCCDICERKFHHEWSEMHVILLNLALQNLAIPISSMGQVYLPT